MSNVNQLVENYIAAWNERDACARSEIIARTWTEDGGYLDPHRSGDGHDQISAMMATVHNAFDPKYRFRLKSTIDSYGDRIRFQWEAGGTEDAPLHFVGTDYGIISSDGRFKFVTGFSDEAPAPARQ
jgi:hypothetical protein